MSMAMDTLRAALATFDARPRHGSIASEIAADGLVGAVRSVLKEAERSPYPARVMPPPRPSLSEDDGA